MQKTLILGLGNILRADDAIGITIIEHLTTIDLPEHVTVLDGGTPGFEIVLLMQGYDHVIVVDAADMGVEAGMWRVFTPDEVRLQSGDLHLRGTLHYAGLAEALNLAAAMNLLPPQVTIIGIQPQSIDWAQGLSAPVAACIPEVIEAIQALFVVA